MDLFLKSCIFWFHQYVALRGIGFCLGIEMSHDRVSIPPTAFISSSIVLFSCGLVQVSAISAATSRSSFNFFRDHFLRCLVFSALWVVLSAQISIYMYLWSDRISNPVNTFQFRTFCSAAGEAHVRSTTDSPLGWIQVLSFPLFRHLIPMAAAQSNSSLPLALSFLEPQTTDHVHVGQE